MTHTEIWSDHWITQIKIRSTQNIKFKVSNDIKKVLERKIPEKRFEKILSEVICVLNEIDKRISFNEIIKLAKIMINKFADENYNWLGEFVNKFSQIATDLIRNKNYDFTKALEEAKKQTNLI